ncbi:MAG: NnrS family protein [Xanthobacteraceae bacterium]|nr:NnrS family protein [Xanthobacteraceae bacterium]
MARSISADASAGVLLAYGFRPFFLATAAWAVAAVVLWVAALAGALPSWLGAVDLTWHQHEMLFGTFSAAVAGFVLTAFPEWTKSDALDGSVLGWIFALWVAGRAAMLVEDVRLDLALLAAAFLPAVTGIAVHVLVRHRPPRLGLFVLLLGLLAALDATWQAGRLGLLAIEPARLALPSLLVYAALVTVASGRIVPIVSQLALRADARTRVLRMEPASSDIAAVTLLALAAGVLAAPEAQATGWIALAAAAAQVHRLCEWWIGVAGRRAFVWPFWFASLAIAAAAAGIGLDRLAIPVASSAIVHALGFGGAAVATLAVMTVAGLLHTGHALRVPPGVTLALLSLSAGTLARCAVPWLEGAHAKAAMDLAGTLWIGGFALYLGIIGPKLVRPRVDGKPG